MIRGLGIKVGVRKTIRSFLAKQVAKFLAFLFKTSSIRPTLVKVIKWGKGFRIFEHSDWEKNKKCIYVILKYK